MSKFYHRGKEARMRGHERTFPDGRVTAKNRQDFYEGWDEQDRHMRPDPTPEQLQEQDEALAGIRAFLDQAKAANTTITNPSPENHDH